MDEPLHIGETLRAARLSKGVSLDQAAAATRIRRSALQALEAEDFDALPAPVYTRGFLLNYARYLGLYAAEIVEEYDRQQRARASLSPAPAPEAERPRSSSRLGVKLLVSLLLMVAIGVILNFLYQEFLSAGPAPAPAPPPREATPTAEPTPLVELPPITTPSPVPTPTTAPTPTPTPVTGVNVTLRATTQQVWVGIDVDGVSAFGGAIGPDTAQGTEPRTWTGTESVSIRLGRTGGVEITVNERAIGPLAESSAPVVFEAVDHGDGEVVVTVNATPLPSP